MSDKNNNNKKPSLSAGGLAIGLCLGVAVGTALWNLTGNFVWFACGISIGLCLGLAFGYEKDDGNGEDNDSADGNDK